MTTTIDPNGGDEAWQAAMQLSVGGAHIRLEPYAIYRLSKPFLIPANVWLEGNQARVHAIAEMAAPFCAWTMSNRVENVEFIDITGKNIGIGLNESCYFSAAQLGVHGFRIGISLQQSWCGSWRDITVRSGGAGQVGIQVKGKFCNAMAFSALSVAGWKRGMDVTGSDHYGWTIQGSFEGNSEFGIRIAGRTEMWHINDCYFESNTEADVCIENGFGTHVENCISVPGSTSIPTSTKRGIWIKRGNGTRIGHNIWYENNAAWIVEAPAYGTEVVNLTPRNHMGACKVMNRSKTTTIYGRPVPVDPTPPT